MGSSVLYTTDRCCSCPEKKRSFVRRHSSRGKRTRQSSGPDSPRLDRHPSLRFSTTRLPSVRTAPPSVVKSCTLAVSQAPSSTAKKTPDRADDRKHSSGSNASSIGTCHDLGPSVRAYSVTRGGTALHPDGNRSSSSAETGAVEAPRDEVTPRRLHTDEHPGLMANRAVDVSHINLLRTGGSEHNLSGSRRRLDESLEVHASNTVDRLSPVACRLRPTTPEDSSDHHRDRDIQLDRRQADATSSGIERPPDIVLIGVSVLALLLLTSPTMVVGLVVALCSGRGGWRGRTLDIEVTFSLHVVAYFGALVRPAIYYVFSRTLRQSLTTLLRCRPASN